MERLRIAVVDDENISDVYTKIFEKLGYPSSSIFKDGSSLVKSIVIDHATFDLIIMDYNVPEMNGIEAAKIIQRYRPQTKIIIATEYEFLGLKAAAEGLPFLLKPFSAEQLSECLKRLEREQIVRMQ